MGKREDFEKFLAKKTPSQTIDWDAEKKIWIRHLDALYSQVRGWLKEYVASGKIKITEQHLTLQEDYVGAYEVIELLIYIGNNLIRMRPIGTLLIAARGRVDVIGDAGIGRLVLAEPNANGIKLKVTFIEEGEAKEVRNAREVSFDDYVWKISTDPPDVKFTELNQESFLDLLMQVSR